MKLKAAVNLPEILVAELDCMRPSFLTEVMVPHLKIAPDVGPAEFYVQACDRADPETHGWFVEARLSGVSVNDRRAPEDIRVARAKLETIYAELIRNHLVKNHPCDDLEEAWVVQLMVSLMLDAPLPGNGPCSGSTLVEGDPCAIWIDSSGAWLNNDCTQPHELL